MSNFQDIPPQDRGLIIAKLYHNLWYNPQRFAIVMKLLDQWELDPTREAKYLNDIHEEININDLIN